MISTDVQNTNQSREQQSLGASNRWPVKSAAFHLAVQHTTNILIREITRNNLYIYIYIYIYICVCVCVCVSEFMKTVLKTLHQNSGHVFEKTVRKCT